MSGAPIRVRRVSPLLQRQSTMPTLIIARRTANPSERGNRKAIAGGALFRPSGRGAAGPTCLRRIRPARGVANGIGVWGWRLTTGLDILPSYLAGSAARSGPDLIVADIDRSTAFYRDLLGFSVVTTVPDAAPFVFVWLQRDNVHVFLNGPVSRSRRACERRDAGDIVFFAQQIG